MIMKMSILSLLILFSWKIINAKDVEIILEDCPVIQLNYRLAVSTVKLSGPVLQPVHLQLFSTQPEVAYPITENVIIAPLNDKPILIYIYGAEIGDTYIKVNFSASKVDKISSGNGAYVLIVHSLFLSLVSTFFGWIYFLCWTASIYPQVYENFRRRSVVGLNFDFLCYNILGYLAYSVYNVGLFYFKSIQDEYFSKFGGSVIPVRANDVFMALHMVLLNVVIVVQVLVFERGNQQVTLLCKVLVGATVLSAVVVVIPVLVHKMTWLTYLNFISYVKLVFVVIKSAPQLYMNCKRKSTVGWSIGGVLLDIVGAMFSMLQMFILAYNNNEWNSIFGDFSKFGLGVLSIVIDVMYMFQHYVLYATPEYKRVPDDNQIVNDVTNYPVIA